MNRLQHESSPYLLQHANNPVDWYAWGPEALERAKTENKPIFLSIGYSACHWCHVMEHESFEDQQIADQLNRDFICIKVDREERPDLDQIYMMAVQLMTGRGGWPMSVFLTPDLRPFFGGTYWPAHAKMGMPGFDQVLEAVTDAWNNRRDTAIQQADLLTQKISESTSFAAGDGPISAELIDNAVVQMQRAFDPTFGGFGEAPKFPHALDIRLLIRMAVRVHTEKDPSHELSDLQWMQMAKLSLDKMALGGIYDHLGGGFARYSVDQRWLVPHFEKMLYDNALLSNAYLDSYLATGNPFHRRIVCETLDYVLRDMTDEAGGFYSTEDADSEGEEGKFYVWTVDEIQQVLGPDLAEPFCDTYDVTTDGNFEGKSILNLARPLDEQAKLRGWPVAEFEERMAEARRKLLAARQQRVRPGRDDKVIVCWNGLMIDSMARAGQALQEARYTDAAKAAANFLADQLWQDGRLMHTWRQGTAKLDGYLDDYAALANALVTLYEATFESRWLDWSFELMDVVMQRFRDPEGGAFFYTADDQEALITRTKDLQDSSVPSGNALAAQSLVRLGHLAPELNYLSAADQILQAAMGLMQNVPAAAGQMLLAADWLVGPCFELVWIGDPRDDAELQEPFTEFSQHYAPRVVSASLAADQLDQAPKRLQSLFSGRTAVDGQTTLYVCQDQTCQAPATGSSAVRQALQQVTC